MAKIAQTKDLYSNKRAFTVALIYFVLGVSWIYFSDSFAETFSMNKADLLSFQTYKGFFYIFFTSILLYILVTRFLHSQFVEYGKHFELLGAKIQLEESLREANFMYYSLVDNMLDSVAHCRMIYEDGKPVDYEYLSVNKIFESMTGLHDVVGHKISEILPTYVLQNQDSMELFGGVASSGRPQKWEHYLKELGQWYSFSIYSPKIGEFIVIASDITEQKNNQSMVLLEKERYDYLAHYDKLTGLPNRLSLDEYMGARFFDKAPLAFMFLDLDGFKEINDSYGHGFGDKLLVRISELLRKPLPENSYVVRTGGDEFVIIILRQDLIDKTVNSLAAIFSNPLLVDGKDIYITARIGIAMYPEDAQTTEELLKCADTAMYNAKNSGKNTYSFYSRELTERALHRTTMAANLKKAMSNNELQLYFQPQVDPNSGRIVGAEALIRWFSPSGVISPSEFIPVAEGTGLILEMGEFVLAEGFKIAKKWVEAGLLHGRVAVNISAHQLTHPRFTEILEEIIESTECSPEWIELEITESSILVDPQKVIALLSELRKKGFHVSIDDFGTGYSSMSYLKNLPIDKLKIDLSFVRNLPNEPKNQTIVKAIIALAKGLDMEVLAEGAESLEEMEFLRQNGIDSIQGYFYFKPSSAETVEGWLCKD